MRSALPKAASFILAAMGASTAKRFAVCVDVTGYDRPTALEDVTGRAGVSISTSSHKRSRYDG